MRTVCEEFDTFFCEGNCVFFLKALLDSKIDSTSFVYESGAMESLQ
jgi:hypothetical protein